MSCTSRTQAIHHKPYTEQAHTQKRTVRVLVKHKPIHRTYTQKECPCTCQSNHVQDTHAHTHTHTHKISLHVPAEHKLYSEHTHTQTKGVYTPFVCVCVLHVAACVGPEHVHSFCVLHPFCVYVLCVQFTCTGQTQPKHEAHTHKISVHTLVVH